MDSISYVPLIIPSHYSSLYFRKFDGNHAISMYTQCYSLVNFSHHLIVNCARALVNRIYIGQDIVHIRPLNFG